MEGSTLRIATSEITGRVYVERLDKRGKRRGDPIDVTGNFWAVTIEVLRSRKAPVRIIEKMEHLSGGQGVGQTVTKRQIEIGIISDVMIDSWDGTPKPAKSIPSHE